MADEQTDRFTARVLGAITLLVTVIIDISTAVLTRPETRSRPGFALVVLLPSLPLFILGAWFFVKARRLPEGD